MTQGTGNFRTSTLALGRHCESTDHKNSLKEIAMNKYIIVAVQTSVSDQDKALQGSSFKFILTDA